MSKARLKVTVKTKTDEGAGTLLARVPIAVEKNDHPSGKKMYETRARLHTRLERGKRPKTTRLKKSR